MSQLKSPPHRYIMIINALCFLMLFLEGCKKDDVITPE